MQHFSVVGTEPFRVLWVGLQIKMRDVLRPHSQHTDGWNDAMQQVMIGHHKKARECLLNCDQDPGISTTRYIHKIITYLVAVLKSMAVEDVLGGPGTTGVP